MLASIKFENCGEFSNLRDLNDSFATASLKVMYLGNNRNGSHFSKKAVHDALPSLYNVPVVAHYDRDENQIGGHDIDFESNDDGELKILTLTEPCGVIPESATFSFVTDQDCEGGTHEYLVVDGVILWKRQDVYQHITEDLNGKVKHSMEISIIDSEFAKNGNLDIKQFEFTALCLLEKFEPCFEGSELKLYSKDRFSQKFSEMMFELKKSLKDINFDETKGGTILEKNKELELEKEEFDESVEETAGNHVIEEETEKEPEAPEQTTEGEPDASEPVVEELENEEDSEEKKEDGFTLNSDLECELRRVVHEHSDDYVLTDFDQSRNEIYFYDFKNFLLYGCSYVMSGDVPVIDWASKKRKKFIIVDFEGEEPESSIFSVSAKEKLFAMTNSLESELEVANNKIEELTANVEALSEFKRSVEEQIAAEERENLLNEFTDLVGTPEFEALTEKAISMDLNTLEMNLYALRGKNMTQTKFSLNKKTEAIKLPISNHAEPNQVAYGGLIEKYSKN